MAIEFPRHPVPSAVNVPVPDYSGQAEMWGMLARTGTKLTGDLSYLADLADRRNALVDRVAKEEAKIDVQTRAELWNEDFESGVIELKKRGVPLGEMEGQLQELGTRLKEQHAAQLKYPQTRGAFELEVLKRQKPAVRKAQDAALTATHAAIIADWDIEQRQDAHAAATAPTEIERREAYVRALKRIGNGIQQGFYDKEGPNGAGTRFTALHLMIEEDAARSALASEATRGETLDQLQRGQFKTPYTKAPVLTVEQQQKLAQEAITASNAAVRKGETDGKARANELFAEVDATVRDLLSQNTPESRAEAERTLTAEPNKRLYIGGGHTEAWGKLLADARGAAKTPVEKDNPQVESDMNRMILNPTAQDKKLTPAQMKQRVMDAGPSGTGQLTPNTERLFLQLIDSKFKRTDEQAGSARALWTANYALIDDSLRQNVGALADVVPNVGHLIGDAKREALQMTHPDSPSRSMTIDDWNRKRLPQWIAKAGAQSDAVIQSTYQSLPASMRQQPPGEAMRKELETLQRAGALKGQEYTRALEDYTRLMRLLTARERQRQAEQDFEKRQQGLLSPPGTPAPKGK